MYVYVNLYLPGPGIGVNPHKPSDSYFELCANQCRGLEYLHLYTDPCIIHRNVKSSNILLDSAWVPHITGFHRAVFCTAGDHVELIDDRLWPASTGPTDAPPSVHLSRSSTIQASKAGDIFGYGVLLLELLIGSQPRDTFGGDHTKSQLVRELLQM